MNYAMEAKHLTFGYGTGTPAVLADVSFDFASGSITALCGPSGRGKSTLLYVLGLMLRPTSGTVLFAGSPPPSREAERAAFRGRHIGLVFQDAQLDPTMTLLDAVCEPALLAGSGLAVARSRAAQLMDRFGVSERRNARPGQISGGQAQRVALARALVNEPNVVLADEPTGNLDDRNATAVLAALRHAADSGATVVVATHDPRVIAESDCELRL